MFIIACQADHQIGDRLGQAVGVGRVIRDHNLRHAVDLRRGLTRSSRARNQNGHIAQRFGSGHRLGGGVQRQRATGDFCKEKNSHYTIPFSFSFDTSSSTEPTISPADRAAGSAVFTISRRGVTSTP